MDVVFLSDKSVISLGAGLDPLELWVGYHPACTKGADPPETWIDKKYSLQLLGDIYLNAENASKTPHLLNTIT